jgi:maleate isomerase
MIDAVRAVDGDDIDAIVQFGANWPMAAIADETERWLGKPFVATNIATYWHALRSLGITDKIDGHSRLMREF